MLFIARLEENPKFYIGTFIGRLMKRGQVSVEFLVVLSIILVILLIVFNTGSNTIGYVKSSSDNTKLSTFFDALKNAAYSVYHQGVGAKTRAYVVMPDNTANVTIEDRRITVASNTGDVVSRNFYFDISGNLSAKGSYYVDVEAKKGYVEFK